MGLTIHYKIKSRARSDKRVAELLGKMRQICMDLPFAKVGELVDLSGLRQVQQRRRKVVRPASVQVDPLIKITIPPDRLITFETIVGPECEPMDVGLCKYPREVKFRGRTIKTRLGGWKWSSFCKTQFANDPRAGGLPNFLRCHISVVTALERFAELPTIKVDVNDEGEYGTCRRARAGLHDIRRLTKNIGESSEMIAAMTGVLRDVLKDALVSPMDGRPDFEELEHRGRLKNAYVDEFLKAVESIQVPES